MRSRLAGVARVVRAEDPLLLLRVLLVVACVPLLMRLRPAHVAWLLALVPVTPGRHVQRIERIRRCVDLAVAVLAPLVGHRCQLRNVTLYCFLRRAGLDVALSFGMTPQGVAAGHCWLVRDGEPFLERRDPRPLFTELLRIPRPTVVPAAPAPTTR